MDFAITAFMLVCVFITLPISNFTELNLNKQIYSEWIFVIVVFPPPHPQPLKLIMWSHQLFCFVSHLFIQYLGSGIFPRVWDNTADGSAISTVLILPQWGFVWPLVEEWQLRWFWLKIFHIIETCQTSRFSRSRC